MIIYNDAEWWSRIILGNTVRKILPGISKGVLKLDFLQKKILNSANPGKQLKFRAISSTMNLTKYVNLETLR